MPPALRSGVKTRTKCSGENSRSDGSRDKGTLAPSLTANPAQGARSSSLLASEGYGNEHDGSYASVAPPRTWSLTHRNSSSDCMRRNPWIARGIASFRCLWPSDTAVGTSGRLPFRPKNMLGTTCDCRGIGGFSNRLIGLVVSFSSLR